MKVERTRVAGICERLYQHVDHKINDGMLGSAQSKIVTYTIEELRGKEARQYIQVAHNTESETRTTIFIRFLGSGDNLFLGIDVCILGELDKKAYGAMQSSTVLCILLSPITLGISLILAYSMWDKVRMRAEYEGDVALARRQGFPGPIKFDAFDEDDITIFIKTTLHAASESILEIFEAEKLPVESLDAFIKQVDSGSTTIINNNGSGSIDMRGAAVGAGSKAGYSKSVAK